MDVSLQHRLYLREIDLLKSGRGSEVVPVNFNYQNFIMVATGLVEHGGRTFVFQTFSCGCGPQPTIWGMYLEGVIPWRDSALRAFFLAGDGARDRELADQTVVAEVYRVRNPAGEGEKSEVTAALRGHFGADKKISFF